VIEVFLNYYRKAVKSIGMVSRNWLFCPAFPAETPLVRSRKTMELALAGFQVNPACY
jgi:hypothetical protein